MENINNPKSEENPKYDILIIGAGIAGLSAALEAAELGLQVLIIEKNPYIGGRITQMYKYFPKLCPPACGLEINIRRLTKSSNIKLLTLSELIQIDGEVGNYEVRIKVLPRYVNENCTICGECFKVCPQDKPNDYNLFMDNTKAINLPYNNCYPLRYSIDPNYCLGESCFNCRNACKYNAIDFSQKPEYFCFDIKSIICASGWQPYSAEKLDNLGFGIHNNVITNIMLERIASSNPPITFNICKKDITEAKKIAFVQCAGSRDDNHLEYCSSVCCMATLKQTTYIRELNKEAEIYIYYIDIRTPGFFEDFYYNTKEDNKIFFNRGKAAKVFKKDNSNQLIIEAEDTIKGELFQNSFDLIILATGMKPNIPDILLNRKNVVNTFGFVNNNELQNDIIACGTCLSPKDVGATVQESNSAIIKALIQIKGNM